jgi:hypothetical protein
VAASKFAWSAIDGRVDPNGDEAIDGDDCHFGLIGDEVDAGFGDPKDRADVLGKSLPGPRLRVPNASEHSRQRARGSERRLGHHVRRLVLERLLLRPRSGAGQGAGAGVPRLRGRPAEPRGRHVRARHLVGTAGADIICAFGGNDTLIGRGGNDLLLGGGGADVLAGRGGADSLRGGTGADILRGGDRSDVLRGGGGNDSLFGNRGGDRLFGNGGNDHLDGGPGIDTGVGGAGFDTFIRCEIRRQ